MNKLIKAILQIPFRILGFFIGLLMCVPHLTIVIIKGMALIGAKMLKWALGYEPDIIDDKGMEEKIEGLVTKFKERKNARIEGRKP